ncbi:DUF3972 domain-containing protein [Sulfurovum sp. ST-21]|uniref:DUF3972 domain-containing protein n=1 Tax=Sulfurovum indicum TaxID=2779528 RepID=A0A7M1S574_9BACT|nr:DUF3972 domain-containing protein [Sulfurovum indicum]QOR61889.1 DUF3972 domain-containing protein [Sulfurovum indicum]
MEKLMKPAEYAKELGISRQAVYAKIKRGILTAKDVEGKLYIVVDNEDNKSQTTARPPSPKSTESAKTATLKSDKPVSKELHKDYKALLSAKDETIAVLKDTVKDLKKSNKQITRTLRGEIDLLKEAFHEMRALYMHQLEFQKPTEEAIDVLSEEAEEKRHWISVKKLFKKFGLDKTKQQEKFLKRLKKAWKSGDERIVKVEGKFRLDASETYEDLLK